MSFTDFVAEIQSPRLRRISQHWETARGAKRMPGWRDLNPVAIGPDLSIVWSWKYDRASDAFTGRLAGDDIIKAFGENPRGKRLEDFFADKQFPIILARYKRIITEPAFVHGSGPVFIHADRYGQGERIVMPLATDGAESDGVFGATVYEVEPHTPPKTTGSSYADTEKVMFFSLD